MSDSPELSAGEPRLLMAVVDDDPHVVRSRRRMLARVAAGGLCRSAHDGFSAGRLLISFWPDLVEDIEAAVMAVHDARHERRAAAR